MRTRNLIIALVALAIPASFAQKEESLQLSLAKAAYDLSINRMELLLEEGAKVNGVVGIYDKTAFRRGDAYSPIGSQTWTPLMAVAASTGIPEKQIIAVAFLLKRGALIDARDSHGASALHIAIDHQNFELAVRLLKFGADPNGAVQKYIDDVDRQTALHRAIGSPMLVEALIKSGADVNAKDADGNTPLQIAESLKYTESAQLLRLVPKSTKGKNGR